MLSIHHHHHHHHESFSSLIDLHPVPFLMIKVSELPVTLAILAVLAVVVVVVATAVVLAVIVVVVAAAVVVVVAAAAAAALCLDPSCFAGFSAAVAGVVSDAASVCRSCF